MQNINTASAVLLVFNSAAVVLMAIKLKKDLKRTLYLYSNIMLIAGILFFGNFAVMNASDLVRLAAAGPLDSAELFRQMVEFPRRFSYYALFPMYVVSFLLCISNLSLIRHEGRRLKNVLGTAMGLSVIGGTLLLYWLSDLVYARILMPGGLTASRHFMALYGAVPMFFLLMVCYFECILAGTGLMGWLAAGQKPAYDKDFIIIPGCTISKTGGLLPLLRGRTHRAIRYAWDQEIASGRPVKYVPSGGQGPDEVMSEASAMELHLLALGAEPYEVFPEKRSTNTLENFRFSKEIIEAQDPDANVAFATTNYHMLRCGLIAHSLGMEAEGIASDTKWYFWPNGFVREFAAILAMKPGIHIRAAVICAAVCAVCGSLAAVL